MFSKIVISLFPSMAIIYTTGSYQNKSIVTKYDFYNCNGILLKF